MLNDARRVRDESEGIHHFNHVWDNVANYVLSVYSDIIVLFRCLLPIIKKKYARIKFVVASSCLESLRQSDPARNFCYPDLSYAAYDSISSKGRVNLPVVDVLNNCSFRSELLTNKEKQLYLDLHSRCNGVFSLHAYAMTDKNMPRYLAFCY